MKLIVFGILILALSACETKSYEKEDGSIDGKAIFTDNCVSCHGESGDAQISNAKDLTVSELSLDQIYSVITNGTKNGMMPYKNIITTKAERKELAKYVMTLRD